MDALTDVLKTIHLSGGIFTRSEFTAPWGIDVDQLPMAVYHIIEHGDGWFALEGKQKPVAVSQGDLIMLPHGDRHQMFDAPKATLVRYVDMVRDLEPDDFGPVRHGGEGDLTSMVCGYFSFDRVEIHPLVSMLPRWIHVKSEDSRTSDWLKMILEVVAQETMSDRPGRGALLDRLLEVLFVEVVRFHIASLPTQSNGWLAALRDDRIGAALGLIHQGAAKPWSVSALASEIGLSRSAFAQRFKELTGQPPGRYLIRWRMHRAAYYLRTEQLTVYEVSERVGYQSAASFSKMFKQHVGVSPAAYRREARERARVNSGGFSSML